MKKILHKSKICVIILSERNGREYYALNASVGKAVKPQQPVCLVEAMLPQERRFGVQRGEERTLYHRNIGGIEHSLEAIFPIKGFRKM